MVKTEKNADLITEIKAGIKKEVSTSCRAKHAYCSICGVDNMKNYCSHYWGKEYETVNGKKICYFTKATTQTSSTVGGTELAVQKDKNNNEEAEINLKIDNLASFLFIEKEKNGGNEDE